jgi:hypothetical protein
MSKRSVKRTLLLLSMGSAAIVALPFPGACAQYLSNADLVNFYQTVGDQSIDAAFDPARNVFGATSDFTVIVVEPTIDTLQTVWDHWVWSSFPQDPVPTFE